jgi:glycine/D-amino acid oxidase-like deaminating enzyme
VNRAAIDLLVIGAGPAGLTLALQAHVYGARVRIIERRPEPFPISGDDHDGPGMADHGLSHPRHDAAQRCDRARGPIGDPGKPISSGCARCGLAAAARGGVSDKQAEFLSGEVRCLLSLESGNRAGLT